MERVKEFSELPREPPEFIEPRPQASWPENGEIKCEDLVIRYAVRPLPLLPRAPGFWNVDPDPPVSAIRLDSPTFQMCSTSSRLRFALVRRSAF